MIDIFYDRQGKPISLEEWCSENKRGERTVEQTRLDNGFFISTIWLGIDMSLPGVPGKPLIFETMVFDQDCAETEAGPLARNKSGKGKWNDIEMERYSTEEDAKKGHRKLVEKYKNERG